MTLLDLHSWSSTSMERRQDAVLRLWKKWFLKVARPPSSTGMRRPQERREMNTATGNDTSLRMDVTPAIGTSLLVACLMFYLVLVVFLRLSKQILNVSKAGPVPENLNLNFLELRSKICETW